MSDLMSQSKKTVVEQSKPKLVMMADLAATPYRSFDDDFDIYRWWEIEDPHTYFQKNGSGIRGIIAAGSTRIDAGILNLFPDVKIISSIGVGYDRLDTSEIAARNIVATNTPDVLNEEVADLVLGLLLATVRQIPQAERHVRSGKWMTKPYGYSASLRGRKVGIAGLGRIGKCVSRRLEGFDVDIAYFGRSRQGVSYEYFPSLLELAAAVDVLILLAPLTRETIGMVDAEVLEALGPDGILLNVGRGQLVQQEALIEALQTGKIRSAGLDVFWNEPQVPADLLALDNVVLLPHVGSATLQTRHAMIELIYDNLRSWFDGKGPLTPVPETRVPG